MRQANFHQRSGGTYRVLFPALVVFLVCGSVGCVETRWLNWNPRPAAEEVKSYDLHDPYPDESIGPDTHTRPRAFLQPRSEPYRNDELRFLRSMYGDRPGYGRPPAQ